MMTGSKFGRIENDKIKLFSFVAKFSQSFEDICFDPLHRAVVKAVAFGIFLGHLQSVGRRVDRDDFFGTAGFEREREPAGVAEAVERSHASAVNFLEFFGKSAGQSAVVALVNVKTGFMAHADVDAVFDSVFHDFDFLRRLFALKDLLAFRKTFTSSGSSVGTVVHLRAAGVLHQCLPDLGAPILGARGLKLCHNLIVVLINNQPGQKVCLSENQTNSIGTGSQTAARLNRSLDPGFYPGSIDDVFFLERPAAGAECRFGRKRAPS